MSQKRAQASQRKGLASGEAWGTSGEVRGTSGEVWETSGEPKFANPFPPYSFQKRPESQICPKFVPAIVFGVSSQGDWNLSKICPTITVFQILNNF